MYSTERSTTVPPTIHGRWWLVDGKDSLALDFDTVTWLMTTNGIPPLPFRLERDSITVYAQHDGEQSTGRIWTLTHEALGIRWTTGDPDLYRR